MRQLSSTEREQVLTFIQQSQKILAIKYIRHLFNYGVSEAKHDVEQLMINPDFEPKIKEQQSDQPSDALYQNLEHNENTLELFLTRNNGEILLIDEQHPEWRAVMLHFNAREFSTKQDYINAMRLKRNAEDLASIQQQHQDQQIRNASMYYKNLLQALQIQDRKNNLIIAISTVTILMICTMYLMVGH